MFGGCVTCDVDDRPTRPIDLGGVEHSVLFQRQIDDVGDVHQHVPGTGRQGNSRAPRAQQRDMHHEEFTVVVPVAVFAFVPIRVGCLEPVFDRGLQQDAAELHRMVAIAIQHAEFCCGNG
ncbi:Uncharacterised protein [Mycobacteroides abscessus subsp. abscessus]|nr:Uncharacterised protein [Mycobacteroides abscessus subsp. abscessus]